jgi:hypothetical protein
MFVILLSTFSIESMLGNISFNQVLLLLAIRFNIFILVIVVKKIVTKNFDKKVGVSFSLKLCVYIELVHESNLSNC